MIFLTRSRAAAGSPPFFAGFAILLFRGIMLADYRLREEQTNGFERAAPAADAEAPRSGQGRDRPQRRRRHGERGSHQGDREGHEYPLRRHRERRERDPFDQARYPRAEKAKERAADLFARREEIEKSAAKNQAAEAPDAPPGARSEEHRRRAGRR